METTEMAARGSISFDAELDRLNAIILEMSRMAMAMTQGATSALLAGDAGSARDVVSHDRQMDEHQRELNDLAVAIIAQRHPVAGDLRMVIGAIRMGADLERIGDLAKSIAKRVEAVGQDAMPRSLYEALEEMAQTVLSQVETVTQLYVTRRADRLEELRERDLDVDRHYAELFRDLQLLMTADPTAIAPAAHMLFCAKNLERIGDHVTNIAENAHFTLTGEHLSIARPKIEEAGLISSPRLPTA
jgi:phosphate transport system protein